MQSTLSLVVRNRSLFSLRPPELLVVSNVSSHFRFFSFSNSKTASQLLTMFRKSSNCLPWINCTGCSVFLRASAVHEFRQFLSFFDLNLCPLDVTRRNAIIDLLDSDCQSFIVFDPKDLLPEIVFRFHSPHDPLTFLVGFLFIAYWSSILFFFLLKNYLVIGNPGTGKTFLSGIALAHCVSNGIFFYITSMASRRSKMLYGEHIHRLFRLNVRNASAESLAHEALTRLNFDHKRKHCFKVFKRCSLKKLVCYQERRLQQWK